MPEPDIWRIRMKVGNEIDYADDAWERGEVGVWYGAWSAVDWRAALSARPKDPWAYLRDLPRQRALEWEKGPDLSPVRRFEEIRPNDWCVLFLKRTYEIGLARLEPGMFSDDASPLNHWYEEGVMETLKYRRISEKKTFSIAALPDAYRLLSAQGRGNVHRFHGMREHVTLLAQHADVYALKGILAKMSFDQLLPILGAFGWESLCVSYLTLEYSFVPTGLATGRTLEGLDIVGRSVPDGVHILAQCKKSPGSVEIEASFLTAVSAQGLPCRAFYFAFGGCHGHVPDHVTVVGRSEMLSWMQTDRGSMYQRFLTS